MLGIFKDIEKDLQLVEEKLQQVVKHDNPILNKSSIHLLNAGGKRLRPAFALLAGRFYNYNIETVLPLAVALELIHMASLVHDDVVDAALIRRGIPTVKAKWGNRISMHAGDVLFGKSLQLIAQYESKPLVTKELSRVAIKMSEGEIQQISTAYQSKQTIKDYFYRIERKTALLIAVSGQLGAVVCGAPKEIYLPLRRYGHKIGMAFQITDDILDMVADEKKLGKPIGGDLRQGIVTLPVIYALNHSAQKERLAKLVESRDKTDAEVNEAINIIIECGGIDYANRVVDRYINRAKDELKYLPDIPSKKVLLTVADFVKHRKF